MENLVYKPYSKYIPPTKYLTNIGITVFANTNIDSAMLEYKGFIENNSKFHVNTIEAYKAPLSYDEIPFWNTFYGYNIDCYFPDPAAFHVDTLNAIPANVDVNIIIFDPGSLSLCVGGATWSSYIHGLPTCIIPLYPDWFDRCGPWRDGITQAMVHEWLHAIGSDFEAVGFTFPSSDDCIPYGFDIQNACWQDCYKFMLSLITDQMYAAMYPVYKKR